MKRPSVFMYGISELAVSAFFTGLIWLIPAEMGPTIGLLAVGLLAISAIVAFWSASNIRLGKRYLIGAAIRLGILAAIFTLMQATDFLGGGLPWILLAGLSSVAGIAGAVLRRLRRQAGIIETWQTSGKLDIQKKRFRLDVRDNALTEKNKKLINVISWVTIAGVLSAKLIMTLAPETRTLMFRLIGLLCALIFALASSYPIGSAIILARIEKAHDINLLTEYSRRNH